jgi:hypothetical protein
MRDDPAGATTLELVHDGLEELAATMPHIAANVGPGWEAILTKLERVLTADGDAARTPGSRREGQEP